MEITIEEVPPTPILVIEEPAPPPVKAVPLTTRLWESVWPVLLAIISPLLWVIRVGTKLYILAYIRWFEDRRVDPCMKCPGCGVTQLHKIAFAETYGCIIHVCELCHAEWGVATVEPYAKWRIGRVDDNQPNKWEKPIAGN